MAMRENESFTAAAKLHIRSRIQDVAMESMERHAERRSPFCRQRSHLSIEKIARVLYILGKEC